MPAPLITQVALSTPFEPNRNPGFGGVASGLQSTDVQNAIEEAKADAIANDLFLILPRYGGNANTGRYLEFYAGISSDIGPLYFSSSTNLLATVLQTTAATATCNMGVFDLNVSSVTPVYTVVMTAQKRVQYIGSPLAVFAAGSLIALQITSGSINTPICQLTLSAAT